MDSILTSIKKLHGIAEEDISFDTDLIIHINSALMILRRIGIGPLSGFFIKDKDPTWVIFTTDPVIAEWIQSLVYAKVKLVFDPPASPTVVDALNAAAVEYEVTLRDWVEGKL